MKCHLEIWNILHIKICWSISGNSQVIDLVFTVYWIYTVNLDSARHVQSCRFKTKIPNTPQATLCLLLTLNWTLRGRVITTKVIRYPPIISFALNVIFASNSTWLSCVSTTFALTFTKFVRKAARARFYFTVMTCLYRKTYKKYDWNMKCSYV